MTEEMTKSLPVSKRMVFESYVKVCAKNGSAGIDRETIDMFNENLRGNLYKLWNRMSSGSYFPPPVRTVPIPKKSGGLRPLGIPTVSDRIAQGVVKDHIEPGIDGKFHRSSYGYRPGKSAHDAVTQCEHNCRNYAWVVDVDIKGFFDNIDHGIMMQLLQLHTSEKWVLMYVDRWLKAGVEQEDGSIAARTKGTPQGGVISPLLSNIYLHHAFDLWISTVFSGSPFERYADDIVIHCSVKAEAQRVLQELHERMSSYGLTLHPEKTKIVYCKDYRRKGTHVNESFTFLGFSFQPRMTRSTVGDKGLFLCFRPAISNEAKKHIRTSVRKIIEPRCTTVRIEDYALKLNNKIRGWINYYCRIERREIEQPFLYINYLLMTWVKNIYRIGSSGYSWLKLQEIRKEQPTLFMHWTYGIRK